MKNLTIKFGDYVRTYDGYIARCERYYPTDDWWHFDSTVISDEYDYDIIDKKELNKYVKKIREKIIDLIEVGDLLFVDVDNDYKGGIIVPRISETQNELDLMVEFIKNGRWILKGIVTREQIEDMEYKIER